MADEKITQKTALTTPAGGDLLYIVDDPSGTPVGKKITLTNLFENVPGTIDLADITDGNIPYMGASGFADSPLSTDGTTIDLTGITDNNIPYMSASGFADSPIQVDGSYVGIGTTPASYLHVHSGTVASLNSLLKLESEYTGTASQITTAQTVGFTSNKDTANVSDQILRFTYTRAAGSTAESTVYDAGIVVKPTYNEDANRIFHSFIAEAMTVASGKTVASHSSFSVDGPAGSGSVTTWRGLYIQSDGTATLAEAYGIIMGDIDNATGNAYAIYTNAGKVRLGDNVSVGNTTPSANADLKLEGGTLMLKETTTPTTDTNYGKVYTKSDNKLYFQDGAGTEHTVAFV